jgi:hypothetical protein
MAQIRHFPPMTIPLATLENDAARIDLEFVGVDHGTVSYEARVFANNADADENTEPTEANGYLGSYFVFGHGGCIGDKGHCTVPRERRPFDLRREHPLTPRNFYIPVTHGLRAICQQSEKVSLTVVAVPTPAPDCVEEESPLKFEMLNVVTYD